MTHRKDAWLVALRARFDAWSADIDRLALQARHADTATRLRLEEELILLGRMREDAQSRLHALARSDEEPPPAARTDAAAALRRLHRAVERVHG